jgi:hypothetical protein
MIKNKDLKEKENLKEKEKGSFKDKENSKEKVINLTEMKEEAMISKIIKVNLLKKEENEKKN